MHTRTIDVVIPADNVFLPGTMTTPQHPTGIVIFAHGSGSSRFSRRNQQVAEFLQQRGFATLLTDLLSADEHERDTVTAEYRFNIPMLAQRLIELVDWVRQYDHEGIRGLPIGLFGASTGAAAALIAAAARPRAIRAVVSRGGRPDLARDALENVRAPTLLIVGGMDREVHELNRLAAARMTTEVQEVVIPGATHLFEEPGKLEAVSRHAADWFEMHLGHRKLLAEHE